MQLLKKKHFLIHILGWLLFVSLPIMFIADRIQSGAIISLFSSRYYWQFLGAYLFIFYFHTYLLAPKIFFKKKFVLYFISLTLLAASIHFIRPFDKLNEAVGRPIEGPTRKTAPSFDNPPPNFKHNGNPPPDFNNQNSPTRLPNGIGQRRGPIVDIVSIFLFIIIIAVSFAKVMAKQWREAVQQAAQAETDKANAELSFLKAQINPHFLFNTLNNIYSMAVTKNNETANSIMKLSNIMRYVTDEANDEYVSLQSEVGCINDYIELQRLRLGKKVQLNFAVTGILDDKKIAPLILMTFIENVFKYGLSNHEESTVTIKLFAEEKAITFLTQNKIFTTLRKVERTGIGIGNTKKRLEHLYPNTHVLNITRETNLFTVQLILNDLKQGNNG